MNASEGLPPDTVVVVFGGNGDLSRRKLLPSLYHLFHEGLLPRSWRVVGTSRREFSDEEFDAFARDAIGEFGRCEPDTEALAAFCDRLSYASGAFEPGSTDAVADAVGRAEREIGVEARRLHYLAVPPPAFGPITEALGEADLVERGRVVYEKPFGLDEASFLELDEIAHRVLAEDQIYRIDHFLGKETLQNVLALRFANGMFEPVWNRAHIDSVQIDVPETLDVGTRAGFYDEAGALRDMVVTHLFQVLSVIAMEPPVALAPDPLMDEKAKVFESMTPLRDADVVRGQYEGYRDAAGVPADSDTETYFAARVEVDNWRWSGTPFYLRTGKAMAASRQTVTLSFREPPRQMWRTVPKDGLPNDHLTLDLASDASITLSFLAKRPGPAIELAPARMLFSYGDSFGAGTDTIGPYERLLLDALVGDQTLFTRADGIGRTWELVRGVLDDPPVLHPYARGSWGPAAADDLVAPRRWHLPEDDAHPG